jgi:hypothetical protein
MQGRQRRAGPLKLAKYNLFLAAVGLGFLFFFGSTSQQPTGWGAAYLAGTPVTVELPSSCDVETIVSGDSASRSTARCEGATWTADGGSRSGTLFAYSDDIDRSSNGELEFTGEARALGDQVYGRPESHVIVIHLTTLIAAGLGVLGVVVGVVGSVVATALRGRRTGPAPAPESGDLSPASRMFAAELGLVVLAAIGSTIYAVLL